MKTRLVGALSASLALFHCDTSPPVEPLAVRPPGGQPRLELALVEPALPLDAGAVLELEPVLVVPDLLGLPHEHRGTVDHLTRSSLLRQDGELAGALAEARRAVHDSPADPEALLTAARLARLTKKPELAAEAFGRLAALKPEEPSMLVQQARSLLEAKDPEAALKVGQEAVERDPFDPEAHHVTGRAHLSAEQLSEAITCFEKAVELDPEHGYALNNLGFAYLRANENEKAVEALTQAADLLPHVAYVHNNLGVALERVGQIEDAKDAYARSTSLSPKYVKAKLNANRVAKLTVPAPELGEMESGPMLPIESGEPE